MILLAGIRLVRKLTKKDTGFTKKRRHLDNAREPRLKWNDDDIEKDAFYLQ